MSSCDLVDLAVSVAECTSTSTLDFGLLIIDQGLSALHSVGHVALGASDVVITHVLVLLDERALVPLPRHVLLGVIRFQSLRSSLLDDINLRLKLVYVTRFTASGTLAVGAVLASNSLNTAHLAGHR